MSAGLLEAGFDLVMGPVILPEDSFVDILRKIICTMYGIATMFGFAVPYYGWRSYEAADENKGALIGLTVLVGIFGFVMCLPTFVYMRKTKETPDWLMQYCLIMAALITCSWDVFTTFFPVRSTSIAIALMTVASRIPGQIPIVLFLVCYYLVVEVRDAFGLPLRIANAYDGSAAEKFLFSFPGILAMTLMPAMVAGMVHEYTKLINGAKYSVKLAQEVSELLLIYDTDGVRETLNAAVEKTEDLSKGLVTAFEQIAENLDLYRPHLPVYVLPRDDAGNDDEDNLDLFNSRRDDGTNASGDGASQRTDGTAFTTATQRRDAQRRAAIRRRTDMDSLHSESDSGSTGSTGTSKSDLLQNESSAEYSRKQSGGFGDFKPSGSSGNYTTGGNGSLNLKATISSQGSSGGGGADHSNNHSPSSPLTKGKPQPATKTSSSTSKLQISSSASKGVVRDSKGRVVSSSTTKAASKGLAAAGFLTGTFVERIVLCRVNLIKLPKLIFGEKLRANADIATPVINKILEGILDSAALHEGTVHAVLGDCLAISWNATVRCSHSDLKACRFLIGLEKMIRDALLSSHKKNKFLSHVLPPVENKSSSLHVARVGSPLYPRRQQQHSSSTTGTTSAHGGGVSISIPGSNNFKAHQQQQQQQQQASNNSFSAFGTTNSTTTTNSHQLYNRENGENSSVVDSRSNIRPFSHHQNNNNNHNIIGLNNNNNNNYYASSTVASSSSTDRSHMYPSTATAGEGNVTGGQYSFITNSNNNKGFPSTHVFDLPNAVPHEIQTTRKASVCDEEPSTYESSNIHHNNNTNNIDNNNKNDTYDLREDHSRHKSVFSGGALAAACDPTMTPNHPDSSIPRAHAFHHSGNNVVVVEVGNDNHNNNNGCESHIINLQETSHPKSPQLHQGSARSFKSSDTTGTAKQGGVPHPTNTNTNINTEHSSNPQESVSPGAASVSVSGALSGSRQTLATNQQQQQNNANSSLLPQIQHVFHQPNSLAERDDGAKISSRSTSASTNRGLVSVGMSAHPITNMNNNNNNNTNNFTQNPGSQHSSSAVVLMNGTPLQQNNSSRYQENSVNFQQHQQQQHDTAPGSRTVSQATSNEDTNNNNNNINNQSENNNSSRNAAATPMQHSDRVSTNNFSDRQDNSVALGENPQHNNNDNSSGQFNNKDSSGIISNIREAEGAELEQNRPAVSDESLLPNVLLTAAAVVGSGWAQVGGSSKRQQFSLFAFSNASILDEAAKLADRGDFISVCRHVQQGAQIEFNLRGCGLVPTVAGLKMHNTALADAFDGAGIFSANNPFAANYLNNDHFEVFSEAASSSRTGSFANHLSQRPREQTTSDVSQGDHVLSQGNPTLVSDVLSGPQSFRHIPQNQQQLQQQRYNNFSHDAVGITSQPTAVFNPEQDQQEQSQNERNSLPAQNSDSSSQRQQQQIARGTNEISGVNAIVGVIVPNNNTGPAANTNVNLSSIPNSMIPGVGLARSDSLQPQNNNNTKNINNATVPGENININSNNHYLNRMSQSNISASMQQQSLIQLLGTSNISAQKLQQIQAHAQFTQNLNFLLNNGPAGIFGNSSMQGTTPGGFSLNTPAGNFSFGNLTSPLVSPGQQLAGSAVNPNVLEQQNGGAPTSPSKQQSEIQQREKSLPPIAAPIYELVSAKKKMKDDDEWLYVIADKKDGIDIGQAMLEAQCTATCDAVAYLAKGNFGKAKNVLARLLKEHPSTIDLPSFQSVEFCMMRLAKLCASNPESFPQFFGDVGVSSGGEGGVSTPTSHATHQSLSFIPAGGERSHSIVQAASNLQQQPANNYINQQSEILPNPLGAGVSPLLAGPNNYINSTSQPEGAKDESFRSMSYNPNNDKHASAREVEKGANDFSLEISGKVNGKPREIHATKAAASLQGGKSNNTENAQQHHQQQQYQQNRKGSNVIFVEALAPQ